MTGVTRENQHEGPAEAGVLGWFRDPGGAERAVESLGSLGIAAKRVQRAAQPVVLEPTRAKWMAGGAIGVGLGALLGLAFGAYLATGAAPSPPGAMFASAVLGAFILGSFGLFAGFGIGRNQARRAQVGRPPGAEREAGRPGTAAPDTVVFASVDEVEEAAASRALLEAGAYAVETVAPGAELPPEAREAPAGS